MIGASRIDSRALRRRLDRAAASYDEAAVLQAEVCGRLLERLSYVALSPATVLDAGCRTAAGARALAERYPQAAVVAVDPSVGMLRQAGEPRFARICAETARLPLPDASVDLLFSNLALPWCDDLDAALCEFRRVIRPNGLVHFATFGPDTLRELRAASGRVPGDCRFTDLHDIGDGLVRAGLVEPVLDVQRYTLTYRDVASLMHDLRTLGALGGTAAPGSGLAGRGRLAALASAYEPLRRAGLLPATCEVVFGQAWGPAGAPQRAQRRGEFTVDADSIGLRHRE